jgi:transposase
MKLYVGFDVSFATTAISVIDEHGRRVKMTAVASDPQAIATALRRHAKKVVPIVLESGQLSTWLTRDLRALDLPVVCVDARQAHRALSGRLNKSDPADAEGLAQLARTGWFREVHIKSLTSDGCERFLARVIALSASARSSRVRYAARSSHAWLVRARQRARTLPSSSANGGRRRPRAEGGARGASGCASGGLPGV